MRLDWNTRPNISTSCVDEVWWSRTRTQYIYNQV